MNQMNYFPCNHYIRHDGTIGECIYCGTRFVRHECSGCGRYGLSGIPQSVWLPLVTELVSEECPTCGLVVDLAQKAETLPGLPDWVKTLFEFAGAAAFAIGGAMVVGGIINAFQRRA